MVEHRILAVDDDPVSLDAIVGLLRDDGHEVHAASSAEEAEALIRKQGYDLIITDLILPRRSGIELAALVREILPHATVLVVTGHATLRSAIDALKAGALDYLTKPVDSSQLRSLVGKALQGHQGLRPFPVSDSVTARDGMLTRSPAMRAVFDKIDLCAANESTVLLQGESGTGKELCARSIHLRSARAKGPFVTLRAGSLPHDRVAIELFGALDGEEKAAGKIQQARGGTLFLEEIDALDAPTQAALLRYLDEGRSGGTGGQREAEPRLIASSHRKLESLVRDGRFREDLFYRIGIVTIELPALRERRDDIPLLVTQFLQFLSARYRKPIPSVPSDSMDLLLRYTWPGNVRELRNVIEHAVILCGDSRLEPDLLPRMLRSDGSSNEPIRIPIGTRMKEIERTVIARTLDAFQWNKNKTAKVLGISRRSLYNKLERYRIHRGSPAAQATPAEALPPRAEAEG